MLRRLAFASFVFTAACAGQQKPPPAQQAAPVQERLRITNQPAFDVASCQPRQLTLPQPPNQAALTGALVAARPQMLECLVDPKNRGEAPSTKVVVKSTVTPEGGSHAVSGENLTPAGTQCIQSVVDKQIPLTALPAGAQPVEGTTDFTHEAGTSPTVKFGVNEGSDFSGHVRLGQATWCECYAGFTSQTPAMLTARIKLVKGQAVPAEVSFEPSGNTETDALAACLKQKVAALPAKLSVDELTFPHRFIHFHSNSAEPTGNLPAELAFLQLELVRAQRSADVAIAFGARSNAAESYDAAVKQFQATKQKTFALVDGLKAKCATLVKAADTWVAAIQAQQQVEQAMVANAQELKAKDPAWGEAETASQKILTETTNDLATAQLRRQDDENACPKERKK
jgi:hypothetical protein